MLPNFENGSAETNGSPTHTVAGIEVDGDGPLVVREKVHPGVPMSLDQALLEMELKDIYSAEKQLLQALPRMAKKAKNPMLRQGFEKHVEQTRGQIERDDAVRIEVVAFAVVADKIR